MTAGRPTGSRRTLSVGLLLLLAGYTAPDHALAQSDSVTVQANADYGASGLKEKILGTDYRHEWTVPMRVPLLDLDSFAGGLTATQRGGGNQTVSLRFLGADGREYTFRSVEKYPRLADEPALANTVIAARRVAVSGGARLPRFARSADQALRSRSRTSSSLVWAKSQYC